MGKTRITAPQLANLESEISTISLAHHINDWLNESRIRQLSPRTIEERRAFGAKLVWFLEHKKHEVCGLRQLRDFFVYLGMAHDEPGGRWGNPKMTKKLRPITIRTYHTQCRVLFNWFVTDGVLDVSPMERIPAPRALADQIRPFNLEQIEALLGAARRTKHPKRDEAIVLLLLDTGMRASELCSLRLRDVDMDTRSLNVLGKGNKRRTVYMGRAATKALYGFLRTHPREKDEALFVSDRGTRAGEPMTLSGLLQLIERLGKVAGIQATRCSPHTFRHTFAVEILRNGGNVFSLQQMLGHTNLQMTNRYVALADADIENQHREFSPADRLGRRKK